MRGRLPAESSDLGFSNSHDGWRFAPKTVDSLRVQGCESGLDEPLLGFCKILNPNSLSALA